MPKSVAGSKLPYMLDPQVIRDNPDSIKESVKAKQKEPSLVDNFLTIDKEWKDVLSKVELLRGERNKASKEKDIEKGRKIKDELALLEPQLAEVENRWRQTLWAIPNTFDPETIIGKDETQNKVVRSWGKPTSFDFYPKDHIALGEALSMIDVEKASTISGARFSYLMGDFALLEFSLMQFALSVLSSPETLSKIASERGLEVSNKPFVPVIPPVMIRPEVFERMGRLHPTEERYYIPTDDTYLVGSAEHTMGPLHMDELLPEKLFPIRYVGFSTSFRREAGSYGRDTRGILRVHQFDKMEIESFTLPELGGVEQEFIVAIQEYLMTSLELPHQVMSICTGDMGGPDYRQYDINTWIPSQAKYRETHTSDYMTDYQARRLNTRVRRVNNENQFVHMNDATVFAMGRTIIAIVENNQQKDGSILVPSVLQKWMGKEKIEKIK